MTYRRWRESVTHAWRGIRYVFRHEQNFRIQCAIAISVVALGIFLGLSKSELILILLLIFSVLVLELLNSAIEAYADAVTPRLSPHVEAVKDIMAAAVLCASVGSLFIGALIFLPRMIEVFF
ncbi:MAG: diacylglycerol kinase family protein [Patescibacteria group bacterium]